MSQRNKFGSLEQPCSKTHWHKNSNEYIEHYESRQSIYVHASTLQSVYGRRSGFQKPSWIIKSRVAQQTPDHPCHILLSHPGPPVHLSVDICFDIVIVENISDMDLFWGFFLLRLIINISMFFFKDGLSLVDSLQLTKTFKVAFSKQSHCTRVTAQHC